MRSTQGFVMERCLALLTRLLRASASSEELRAVTVSFSDPAETLSAKARERRFEEDLKRLRDWFGCDVIYDHSTKRYRIDSIVNAPFDLPDDALRGLAFLQANFSNQSVPMRTEVLALFESIRRVLPESRWEYLRKHRGQIEIDLAQRDSDDISEPLKEQIRTACIEQRLIEFAYKPNRTDGEVVCHRVEPYTYFFENGHHYLEAYILESRRSNALPNTPGILAQFRLGRIIDLTLLPNKFYRREHFRRDDLIYRLSPQLAQHGVTERFPDSEITMQPDGSALVHATSTNLFVDVRKLLHYGAGCMVIGGEVAVRQMRKIVNDMSQLYS